MPLNVRFNTPKFNTPLFNTQGIASCVSSALKLLDPCAIAA